MAAAILVHDGPIPDDRRYRAALSTVMEPELHRDIVSLHMVKDIRCEGGAGVLKVVLTTPACPLTGRIEADIRLPWSTSARRGDRLRRLGE